MPTYTYKCSKCSITEDIVHGIHEEYLDSCTCGGEMQKMFYPASVSFKGSGFYSTDSKDK